MRLCIVQPTLNAVTETFLRAHAERLPADVTVVHKTQALLPAIGGRPALSQLFVSRMLRKAGRIATGRSWDWEITAGYLAAFRQCRADVVLAQFGPTGVAVQQACEIAKLPFVVHFHGYDASARDVLARFGESYRQMFRSASAVVSVSRAMRDRLLEIGADPERTHLNVYGIDCEHFTASRPQESPPTFLAVGRFVEKKAPYLTVLAFAKTLQHAPDARLRMIGEGPLFGPCKDLVGALGVEHAVEFLGEQPQDVVAREMKSARAFVQHSIEAATGDCEGTPLVVLEAGASGIPVVSTRHGGIPDVVIDGETGFLVDEKDVSGMADRMIRVATDPELAGRLGAAARDRISKTFTLQKSLNGLYDILLKVVAEASATV